MKIRKSALLFLLMVLTSVSAYADAEFYGIQMQNERIAKSLVLGEGGLSSKDILEGSLFNKSVYATASLRADADQHVNFSVNVFNNTDNVIPADYQYRDYYLVTKEDRKYPLFDPETQFDLDEILPKTNVTFQPSLGNLVISKKNIKMIVCSFDLGRTTLILFPSSKKEAIEKLVTPPLPWNPVAQETTRYNRGLAGLFGAKDTSGDNNDPVHIQADAPQGDRAIVNSETQQVFDWPKDNPTQHTQSAVQAPHADDRVAQAIKNFVYVPASAVENTIHSVLPGESPRRSTRAAEPSAGHIVARRSDAQVLQYNPSYKFITFNAGVQDGLQKNMLIYVLRDGKTVAQARIKQIREAVSAASVIPDSVISEVRAGDKISLA